MKEISNMNINSWLLLLLLSFLWGGSFFFIEIALTGLPIFTIVFLRVFIGTTILFAFLLITGKKIPKSKRIWLNFLVMGLLNNVIPFCLIVSGQRFISGGFASILNATTPFFTVIVAQFLTKDEKMNVGKAVGVIFGFFGVLILIGFESLLIGSNKLFGIIAVLIAAISYAFAGIWGRRFKSLNIDPVVTATGQLISSSFVLLPIMLTVNKPWNLPMPGLTVWGSVFGIALFSTALAYIIYFKILSTSGATNVLLVTFLLPISAILLGVFILSEQFYIQHLFGMIVIGIGLVFIDGRLLQRIRGQNNVTK
jgi:drug/metabolite transporter (DMT)-like permease